MIKISSHLCLSGNELKFIFTPSPGPGGQNVNKVATAVQLRFNVVRSPSLTEPVRERLILLLGNKLTNEGELIIKASRFRTQERNKHDAIKRLKEWIIRATIIPKKRKKTSPTAATIEKRLQNKKMQARKKLLRRSKADL